MLKGLRVALLWRDARSFSTPLEDLEELRGMEPSGYRTRAKLCMGGPPTQFSHEMPRIRAGRARRLNPAPSETYHSDSSRSQTAQNTRTIRRTIAVSC